MQNQRPSESPPLDPAVPYRVTVSDHYRLLDRLSASAGHADAPQPSPLLYALALRAQQLRAGRSFGKLISPPVLYTRVKPHPYQLRVVERVMREMAPAAILADEVGLGKTIEAGLILKELTIRGVVRSVLVLAPKALLSQWQQELHEHFDEELALTDERGFQGFAREDRIICSMSQFVRSFDKIGARMWDLLIVDEAHLLANPHSKRRQCVASLRTRWRLLLTATPVANKLTDLYSLVDLVSPGKLGTLRQFEDEYVADPGTSRIVRPRRLEQLRAVVREVSCRTRRSDTNIPFSGRVVQTRTVEATGEEDAFISDVTDYLRKLYRRIPSLRRAGASSEFGGGPSAERQNRGTVIREIMALQQSLSSSPQAIEQSLRRRAERHEPEREELSRLADRAGRISSAKELLLRRELQALGDEPVLIFTLRLETAARLRDILGNSGRRAECYVGALNRTERETLIEQFNEGRLDALIATDAGAEGLNLQHRCHVVVNYDLHWNPMRIEQRIGRVHRLGQSHDVSVYNFVLKDSVDDYVVRLLYQKIGLFTMTIGALETVLAEAQEGEIDIEERVLEALLRSETNREFGEEVDTLGNELAQALGRQHAAQAFTAGVLE